MNDIIDFQDSFSDLFKWQKSIQEIVKPYKKLNKWIDDIPMAKFIKNQSSLLSQVALNNPLYQYAQEMQSIIDKYSFADLSYYTNLVEVANNFIEEKGQAENNYYHNLIVEENQKEITKHKQQSIELENQNKELEQKVKELEITLKTIHSIIPQPKDKTKSIKNISLKPNLTPNQIVRLSNELGNIFDATLEQWQNLFSENIKLKRSIIVKDFKSDIKVLFHYLKENNLIETNQYASILETSKAFSFENKPITAKQINATKENDNFPYMGNHIKIQSVIEKL